MLTRLSTAWIVLLLIAVVGGQALAPHDPATINLENRLAPPVFLGGEWTHVFGTDQLGRDLLSRMIVGAKLSVLIALVGTLVAAVLGGLLGIVAAWRRGWVEDGIMMMVDVQASLPYVIFALSAIAFFGGGFVLFLVVVGLYGWDRYARVVRAETLVIMQQDYVQAQRLIGSSIPRIYGKHLLPNVANVIIVNASIYFPQTMLLESTLSFLGLGVQPPMVSLGSLLDVGRDYVFTAWWIAVLPGLAIACTALAVSAYGDNLRDRLDPTLL